MTYDGERFEAAKTSDVELQYLTAGKGRRAEIYSGLKRLRDRYAEVVRARFPRIPRRVSGYNLDELLPERGFHVARALVGSECTCALALEATVRLVYRPPARTLVVLGYPDIYSAADHVMEIMEYHPIGLESVDDILVENMRKKGLHTGDLRFLPEGKGFLLVEFGGETRAESDEAARRLMSHRRWSLRRPAIKFYDDPAEEKLVWEIRESGLGATARVPQEPDTWPGWEDSAVPPENLGRICGNFAVCSRSTATTALYTVISARAASTRESISLSGATPESVNTSRSSTMPRIW